MRQLILVSTTTILSTVFLLVGCGGGGGSQAQMEHHAHQSHSATLALHPEGDSGVRGTATFKDAPKGIVVKLRLRGLPKPDTLYLAHIHPGTCAQEEEGEAHEHGKHGEHAEEGEGHEHMEEGHEHGEEIEYPLSQVKSELKGNGSSTSTLHDTSVDKLFSGGHKHVNVHEAGGGNPPVLTCAELKRAG